MGIDIGGNKMSDLMKNMLIECGQQNLKGIQRNIEPIQLSLKKMQKRFIETQ
ncbi:MAG: hypothetical protein KAX15_04410 [Candidatus Omnitrophica bacterium]|nr:hypothetical protein [Candidatus Omnitrophota bacterium]